MIQQDSLTLLTDTLNNPVQEDVVQRVSDTIQVSTDTIMHSADTLHMVSYDFLKDTTMWASSAASHFQWPATIFGDTLITPSSLSKEIYEYGEPLSYSLLQDNWVTGTIIGCFIILVGMIAWSKDYILTQARNFFVPTNNNQQQKELKTTSETLTPFIMVLILCINNGVLFFVAASHYFDLNAGIFSPSAILGICIGTFAIYQLLRWLFYSFINWIFFNKSEKKTWNGGYAFLSILESIISYPIIIYTLNSDWNINTLAIILVSAYGLIRFFLLCHSFRIFFHKIYGLLHLFAYLCTLEIIPLLFLWETLTLLSAELVTK